jgi:hypothetical protein
VKYTQLYSWPFSSGRDALARDFFNKAKSHFAAFPFQDNAAVCLCEGPNGFMCLVFVDSDSYRDDSIERSAAIDKFLQEAGCPKADDTEDANWDGQMSLGTIDRTLAYAHLRVLDRVTRPVLGTASGNPSA